jgi:hypothetical protein
MEGTVGATKPPSIVVIFSCGTTYTSTPKIRSEIVQTFRDTPDRTPSFRRNI